MRCTKCNGIINPFEGDERKCYFCSTPYDSGIDWNHCVHAQLTHTHEVGGQVPERGFDRSDLFIESFSDNPPHSHTIQECTCSENICRCVSAHTHDLYGVNSYDYG